MDEWVLLGEFSPPEADVVKSLLESSGIEVWEMYEAVSPILGVLIGPIAVRRLYVKINDLETARGLIGGNLNAQAED